MKKSGSKPNGNCLEQAKGYVVCSAWCVEAAKDMRPFTQKTP
jgi:hypothetical protein